MFGCLGRLGCLFVLLVVGALAYVTRDRWMPHAGLARAAPTGAPARADAPRRADGPPGVVYAPVSDSAARRARRAVESLGPRRGYVALTPEQAVSYLAGQFVQKLPASAERVEAAAEGERLVLRAEVPVGALAAVEGLGPVRAVLGERATITARGALDVVRPGLAQFRIEQAHVGSLPVPDRLVPRLLREVWQGERSDGVAPDAIGIEVPADVGEIRVRDDQVIFYRTVR